MACPAHICLQRQCIFLIRKIVLISQCQLAHDGGLQQCIGRHPHVRGDTYRRGGEHVYALCRLCIRCRKPVRGIRNKRELGTGFGHHKCLGCIIGRGRCMQYGQPDPGIQKKTGQEFIICLCIQCRIPQTLARHLRRSDVRILTGLAHLTGHRSEIM